MTIGTYMHGMFARVRRLLLVWVLVPALALAQSAPVKPGREELEAQVREQRHAMALHPNDAGIIHRLVELFAALAEDYELEAGRQLYQAENAMRYAKQVTRAAGDDPISYYWFAQASLLWGATNGVQNSLHLVPAIERAIDRCLMLAGTATGARGSARAALDCQRLRVQLQATWPAFPVSVGNGAAAEKLLRELLTVDGQDLRVYFVALPMAIRANNTGWVRELSAALASAIAVRPRSEGGKTPVMDRYLTWKAADVLAEAQQWLGYQKP